jgi:hypothetical protein
MARDTGAEQGRERYHSLTARLHPVGLSRRV